VAQRGTVRQLAPQRRPDRRSVPDLGHLPYRRVHLHRREFREQCLRQPGDAQRRCAFWLPSLDELLKAAYYDPERYGEGEEGYWLYPNGSDTPPAFGAPPPEGDGDWGAGPDDEVWEELTGGRYPHTVSPWGLLDVVGTSPEWTEAPWGVYYDEDGNALFTTSSRTVLGDGSVFPALIDDSWLQRTEISSSHAFRVATIVPAPAAFGALGFLGLYAARRRR
jgi:hypothetical protein